MFYEENCRPLAAVVVFIFNRYVSSLLQKHRKVPLGTPFPVSCVLLPGSFCFALRPGLCRGQQANLRFHGVPGSSEERKRRNDAAEPVWKTLYLLASIVPAPFIGGDRLVAAICLPVPSSVCANNALFLGQACSGGSENAGMEILFSFGAEPVHAFFNELCICVVRGCFYFVAYSLPFLLTAIHKV